MRRTLEVIAGEEMISREFKSTIHVVADSEIGELLRWAQRHSLQTYSDIFERLVFIHAMQSEHQCDDRCKVLSEPSERKK